MNFSIFGISVVLVVLALTAWNVSLLMTVLLAILLWVVLLTVEVIHLIATHAKPRPPWRLLAVTVALVLTCWSCWEVSKQTTIGKVQSEYERGLTWFVGDLKEMTIAGRTDEVVRACERFQKDFNIWYEGNSVSNFWNLVGETTEIAKATNQPTATR